jgi:hypothetical protein
MKIKNLFHIVNLKFVTLMQRVRPRGQMSIENEVGRILFAICGLHENKTIVEIGTWNGLGSSTVIAQGVASGKQNAKVYGLEIFEKRVKESKKNLRKYDFFNVIHGRIVDVEDLDSTQLLEEEIEWFESDLRNMSTAPNVLNLLPQQIDVLLLDGGEFSSYSEYLFLKDRGVKWLILDDVNVRKNRRVLSEAITSGKFQLIWKSDERHGAAVLIRKD